MSLHLTRAELQVKDTCYVTIGNKIYDVTSFLDDHPGGDDLILDYAGKDVSDILQDGDSHFHSETAYEILEECHVGFLRDDGDAPLGDITAKYNKQIPDDRVDSCVSTSSADHSSDQGSTKSQSRQRQVFASTGMATAEDLSKDTDMVKDYQTHQFLDLNKPLFPQLWYSGFSKDFYLQQVHRPRHYRGGESAPLFGNFLEPLTKTPWWVIPIVWVPWVTYGLVRAHEELSTSTVAMCFAAGLCIWTLVEYGMHRCLFHLDNHLPDNRVAICLHFLGHGVHHYLPMDKYRLVMPPTLFVILATPFWKFFHAVLSPHWHLTTAMFSGGVFGYICYDLTHYFLHHRKLPAYYRELKKYHLEHHFADYENGFGVTSRFWDRVFGTELVMPAPRAIST